MFRILARGLFLCGSVGLIASLFYWLYHLIVHILSITGLVIVPIMSVLAILMAYLLAFIFVLLDDSKSRPGEEDDQA